MTNPQSHSEVIPEVVFLGKLIRQALKGKIRVPKFQRSFVWRQQDILALLDSVVRGYPIGSILVWETETTIDSDSKIGPVEIGRCPPGHIGYLLDGQQRVSTLVGTLCLDENGESVMEQVDWRVYYDLDTSEFIRAPRGGPKPQHFPVASLLDTVNFLRVTRNIIASGQDDDKAEEWLTKADRLANALRDYQLPVIRIRDADLDTAVTVFARLNRTGRRISADEMVSALTFRSRADFYLARELDDFVNTLARRGFGRLDRVLVLRSVLAALDLDIYAKDWADLMVKPDVIAQLPEAFQSAVGGINRALNFLQDIGVVTDRLLPYGLQLVLLGEFFRSCPQPEPDQRALLERWFWVTSFTGWFGQASTSRITHALREMCDFADGQRTDLNTIDLDAPALSFPDRFDGRSARVRAFLLYLVSLKPRSLVGTGELDCGNLLSTLGTRAVGHVFQRTTDLEDLNSSPANRMFVDQEVTGPAFHELKALNDDNLQELLPSHGFTAESIRALRDGDYAGFIRARLDSLMAGEREFMRERKVCLPVGPIGRVVADSDVSDADQ